MLLKPVKKTSANLPVFLKESRRNFASHETLIDTLVLSLTELGTLFGSKASFAVLRTLLQPQHDINRSMQALAFSRHVQTYLPATSHCRDIEQWRFGCWPRCSFELQHQFQSHCSPNSKYALVSSKISVFHRRTTRPLAIWSKKCPPTKYGRYSL